MVDYVIYGKIIIDDIVVAGSRLRSVLGGGGPQAAFGARLWNESVGFLSRSGGDLDTTDPAKRSEKRDADRVRDCSPGGPDDG